MAVFTKVTEEELALFLADYDLGAARALIPIEEGIENTNYRLETEAGLYVLTLFERRTPEEALPYVVGFMRHLDDAGAPVPRPVADRDGLTLKRLAGRFALIVTFLPGKSVVDPGVGHCREAGRALAKMHGIARSYGAYRSNPFGVSAWPKLLAACRARAPKEELAYLDAAACALERLSREWPRALPRGACHTDLFPDNVFFEGGRVSGLIDFYFCCDELFSYDLAVCIASWAFDRSNRFVAKRARGLIEGYRDVRTLSSAEREVLPLLCLGAAVRFTLTRAYDKLHPQEDALVQEKDPQEFAARIVAFQALLTSGEWLA